MTSIDHASELRNETLGAELTVQELVQIDGADVSLREKAGIVLKVFAGFGGGGVMAAVGIALDNNAP